MHRNWIQQEFFNDEQVNISFRTVFHLFNVQLDLAAVGSKTV